MGVAAATKDAYSEARGLAERLARLQGKLDRVVARVATTKETSGIFWTQTQREIRKVYDQLRFATRDWFNTKMTSRYKEALRVSIANLKQNQFTPKTVNFNQFTSTNAAKQSLMALLEETNATFANGYRTGETTMIRLTRYTQQVNVREKEIERAIADGYLEKGSVYGSAKRLRDILLKKAQDGKYITVIDKNGDPRQYTVKNYAELVARTKLMEASTQAVINTTTAVGGDLVEVSAHNTRCEICSEFEGKIYSLSGNDPDFPPATELPPYHPNCLHSVTTTFREGMEQQGTLEKFIEFSNGETETHPTRTSFIPVSQREEEK